MAFEISNPFHATDYKATIQFTLHVLTF